VAAAVFYLQQEKQQGDARAKPPERSAYEKPEAIADQVNELLSKVSHEELKQFIRDKTTHDRAFRHIFLTSFAHLNSNESKAFYENQVKAFIEASAGWDGFIEWSAVAGLNRNVNQLLDTAQKQLEAGNYQRVFFIATAVMDQLVEVLQYADDSNDDIGGNIIYGYELLQQLAQVNPDEQLRKQVWEYCFNAFAKEKYAGWDWHIDLLQLAADLIKTNAEASRILEQINRMAEPDYQKEAAELIQYEILWKMMGEGAANDFLKQHLANPEIRRKSLQKAFNRNEYEKAMQLAQEGIAHDQKDRPGLALEWYEWLLKIARRQGDSEKIIEYARYLRIANFRNEQDYHQILKAHVKPENWNAFIEHLLADIYKQKKWVDIPLIADIYIREKWWKRLLELVKKYPELHTIQQYEKYLAPHYADEIADMYSTCVMQYLEDHTGRKHYQFACRYLRRMIKLGRSNKAHETIAILRKRFPRRRALMEELNKV